MEIQYNFPYKNPGLEWSDIAIGRTHKKMFYSANGICPNFGAYSVSIIGK